MNEFDDEFDDECGDSEDDGLEEGKSGSGAGATNSRDKKKSKPFKIPFTKFLVEFEDKIIDYFSIKGVEKRESQDLSTEQGYVYELVILKGSEGEMVFKYMDDEIRDRKFLEFKVKLKQARALIV